jgi:HTH-type transcriptional regulator / antitoxin HigA
MATETLDRPWSDLAIPPGEFLEEEMAEVGMTQQDLANRAGRPVQVINEILRGKKAITQDTAIDLERVLGIPAHLWVNLEADYQLTRARLREQEELSKQEEWLSEFPWREMEKRDWMPKAATKTDRLRNLLRFFGVASFEAYQTTSAIGYRITPGARAKFSEGALQAWLRKGELDGREVETGRYDPDRFLDAIQAIRRLGDRPAPTVLNDMSRHCASAGVALVLTPPLPKSGASGCARWLTPQKALIQLSVRGRSDDKLWFDFFHECGHIVKHKIRQVFVEGLDGDDEQELEADQFASDQLIAPAKWQEFTSVRDFSAGAVLAFAAESTVTPGVVVGRLQHEGRVPFSALNGLKTRLQWSDG